MGFQYHPARVEEFGTLSSIIRFMSFNVSLANDTLCIVTIFPQAWLFWTPHASNMSKLYSGSSPARPGECLIPSEMQEKWIAISTGNSKTRVKQEAPRSIMGRHATGL